MTQPSPSDSAATSTSDPRQAQPGESVDRARTGDQNAFTQLFEYYYGPICTYLAQETFIRAWQGLQKLQGEIVFCPWLFRIATNVARSYLRRE